MQSVRSKLDRRGFLRALTTASGAVGAGVALVPVTTVEAEAYDPGPDETRARYRLTDDVKAFYRTNGY
ncbi:MAG: formate dehydrogenase, partial [Hyphomicrobiales bacterium]|nr:formate dehydrogenase [Hyphomicrobiales bacterium]